MIQSLSRFYWKGQELNFDWRGTERVNKDHTEIYRVFYTLNYFNMFPVPFLFLVHRWCPKLKASPFLCSTRSWRIWPWHKHQICRVKRIHIPSWSHPEGSISLLTRTPWVPQSLPGMNQCPLDPDRRKSWSRGFFQGRLCHTFFG